MSSESESEFDYSEEDEEEEEVTKKRPKVSSLTSIEILKMTFRSTNR